MSTPHRATPEQWENIEEWGAKPGVPNYSSVILELRARIEALEQGPIPPMAERQPATEWIPSTALLHGGSPAPTTRLHSYKVGKAEPIEDWGKGHTLVNPTTTEPPPLDVPQSLAHDWINRHGTFRTVSTGGQRERTGTDWGMVITEAARWGQRLGWDARGATTGLAERKAAPTLRHPCANTIAECGGPCEQDFRLCDCGLLQQLNPQRTPAPTTEARPGGLVEKLGAVIEWGIDANQDPEGIARAAIREVAKWLDGQVEFRTARLLRREADRG
jgi:hypothetical protein